MEISTPSDTPDSAPSPALWLMGEYQHRHDRHPKFSRRAFARLAGIPPGRMHELLSGQRPFTRTLATRIFQRLKTEPSTRARILEKIESLAAQRRRKRRLDALGEEPSEDFAPLSAADLDRIGHWHYPAILNLLSLDTPPSSVDKMAERLGLAKAKVMFALRRLEEMGLVALERDLWRRTLLKLTTKEVLTSRSLRRVHRQFLRKAIASLDSVSPQEREICGMTIRLSLNKLADAKQIIENFRRELAEYLEHDDNKDRVYQLCVAFFPLEKGGDNGR